MPTFPLLLRLEWRRVRRDRATVVAALSLATMLVTGVIVSRSVDTDVRDAHTRLLSEASHETAALRHQLESTGGAGPVWSYSIVETASLPPRDLSWLSTGAADLQPTVARLAVYSDPLALFEEAGGTRSAAVLAAGRFDIAFVLVWLLPLTVIATTFSVVSADRESGVLAMTLSQPVTLRRFTNAAITARAGVLSAVAIGVLGVASLVSGAWGFNVLRDLVVVGWAIVAYIGFWAALSRLVNLLGGSSSLNAIVLGVMWVGMVALLPPVTTSIADVATPIDRAGVAAHAQAAYARAAGSAPELLEDYYGAHPEFDPRTAQGIDVPMREFWVVLDRRAEDAAPAIAAYERRRHDRTRLATLVQLVAPPVALQRVLEIVAGANEERLFAFQQQVRDVFDRRQALLVPWLFRSHALRLEDLDALPTFRFREPSSDIALAISVAGMSIMAALVWRVGAYVGRRHR
jgi:ABC-2 type transport system permease protein